METECTPAGGFLENDKLNEICKVKNGDNIEQRLSEYEGIIRCAARKYAMCPEDIEDFEQIGRIDAWKVLENGWDQPAYIAKAVKNAMLDEIVRRKAKKRKPEQTILSLNQPLNEDSDTTLEDLVGTEDDYLLQEELVNLLKDVIRQKYGRYFIEGIRKERRPKIIVRNIIRTAIEEVAKIHVNEIPDKVDYNFFRDRDLGGLLWAFYRNSAIEAVMDAYPNQHMPWNFNNSGMRFWKGERGWRNGILAMNWFVRKKGLKDVSDCRHITHEDFEEVKLGGMLNILFRGSPYLALKTVFPNLKPWQTAQTTKNYFEERENRIYAVTEYLIGKGVGNIGYMNPEEVFDTGFKSVATKESLCGAGLRALLAKYSGSTYFLFTDLFPEQILPWSIKGSKEAWEANPKETAGRAVRWLFEKYLGVPMQEIPEYATCRLFWNCGFSGILTNRSIGFNSSTYLAVDNAYPGMFSREDFRKGRETVVLDVKKRVIC